VWLGLFISWRLQTWARAHYNAVLAVDGSTLEALLRQVGLLRDRADTPLAGRMTALLDLCSRLPRRLWYEPAAAAHDQRAWPDILAALPAEALLVFDLGYINFTRFAQLTLAHVTFVTRAKSNLSYLAAEAVDLGIVKRKRQRDPTPRALHAIVLGFCLNGLILQRYLSPEAVLTTWKQACNRSV